MSSAVALVVFPLLLQCVLATFPPVLNPPPIPSQAVRTVDISGQRYYLQDDLQSNQPQNVIKEDGYITANDKIDPRWFAPENQSGETGDFPNNDDAFDRYYANGLPAVGPVATPLPDDNYVAQPSVTSKVTPDGPANVGSDIWVLTKGPNDQLIPERWVQVQVPQIQLPQVQVPQDKVVEVGKSDFAPKQYTENVKSFQLPPPPPPSAVKGPVAAPPPSVVQQIWVRAPVPIQSQKVIQNTDTYVEDIPSVKQIVDIPPPSVKQYVQPQIIKEAQPLPPPPPPPPPAVIQKSSSFVLPPPPPPPIKGTDFTSPKQTVVVNQPVPPPPPVVEDQVVTVGKSVAVPQVKHIWIPTSPQTGKFITVPVGAAIDGGKSIPSKGVPVDVPGPPISVSETWVLKQDGFLPRFVEQKPVVPVMQKGNVIVESSPKVQFDSPPNPLLVGKSIDAAAPVDIWPSKNIPEQALVGKYAVPPPPPVFPAPVAAPVKSDAVVISKGAPVVPPPQKTIISSVKGLPQLPPSLPPPPPPQILAPVPQIINGKPCPIAPQKFSFPPRTVPMPAFRTVAINRPPVGRIMRINRYPYGSYYVLNQRIGPSLYPYPRPPVIQQTKNGAVRLISANPVAVPLQQRQLAVPVVRKQVVPVSNVKSAAPVLLYPPVNRIRYAYPWGSYIRSLPVTAGKNIFILPPNKPAKVQAAKKSSSSESSSSESSSSESKSVESKPKSKEAKKVEEIKAESIESIESEELAPEPEPEPEREIEDVETAASEAEPETEEAPTESEAKDSIEVEESQIKPQFFNRAYIDSNTDNLDLIRKPFLFNFDQRDTAGTTLHKEVSDANGKVVGNYGYHNSDGTYKKIAYISDADGYRAQILSNEPSIVSHNSANVNLIPKGTPENTTNKISEIATAASHENLTVDPQRD
ncbi:uncharacterized protein TNCV_4968111 [Trichonephila clavipes]|nr:uncharacterized protein TNCV_4968111 [Trichonephila clavipes]